MADGMKQILGTLAHAFDTAVSPQRAAVYAATLLERYTREELSRAARELLFTSKRFPTIADFVEAREGKQETVDNALQAEASEEWGNLLAERSCSKLADKVCKEITGTMYPGSDISVRDAGFHRRAFLEG